MSSLTCGAANLCRSLSPTSTGFAAAPSGTVSRTPKESDISSTLTVAWISWDLDCDAEHHMCIARSWCYIEAAMPPPSSLPHWTSYSNWSCVLGMKVMSFLFYKYQLVNRFFAVGLFTSEYHRVSYSVRLSHTTNIQMNIWLIGDCVLSPHPASELPFT